MRRFLVLAVAALGAAAAYFSDPQNGRRRRHQTRDRALKAVKHVERRGLRRARHTVKDAYGVGQRLVHRLPRPSPDLDDATLTDKVESIVFRDRDVPKGQINVNTENGVVFLRGQVESPELVEELEARVRRIRGVRGVENLLHPPGAAPAR
jgi:osmotically-inducible protein OsmY